jgi:hypothetical protein
LDLIGSLIKMAAPSASSSGASPAAPRLSDRSEIMGVVFGSAAPQVEGLLASENAGRVIGGATVVVGALLLPKLLGGSR